jgi:hypothetical protein
MDPLPTPGTRVLVRHDRCWPCFHHCIKDVPLFQNIGVVDRLDDRWGEHRVVVMFAPIRAPHTGEPWVDAFTPAELVIVEP